MTFEREDVIEIVKNKTNIYKTDIRVILDAYQDAIEELLGQVKFDDPVKIKLFPGFYMYAERQAPRPSVDPRTGEKVVAREKVQLDARMTKAMKWRVERLAGINVNDRGVRIDDESTEE